MTPSEMSKTERYASFWTLFSLAAALLILIAAPPSPDRIRVCAALIGFALGRNWQVFHLELRWMRIVEK